MRKSFSDIEILEPTTQFNFVIPFDSDKLDAGSEYRLKGELKYGENNAQVEPFDFGMKYTEDSNVKSLNTNSKEITKAEVTNSENSKSSFNYLWLIIPIIVLLIAGGVLYFILRDRKMYVIYSDDSAVKMIDQDNPLFNEIVTYRKYVNPQNFEFRHLYYKKQNRSTKEDYYILSKSEKLK